MSYPFTLDEFQQQAVARLERAESVFVAAHTSAGKTVGKFRLFDLVLVIDAFRLACLSMLFSFIECLFLSVLFGNSCY